MHHSRRHHIDTTVQLLYQNMFVYLFCYFICLIFVLFVCLFGSLMCMFLCALAGPQARMLPCALLLTTNLVVARGFSCGSCRSDLVAAHGAQT